MKNIIWTSEETFVEYDSPPMFGEIATRNDRGTLHNTLLAILPNPDPVLANIGRDTAILQDVLTDPHVAGAVDARKAGVLSMKHEIDRDAIRKGLEPSRAANVVRDCFARLNIRNVISEILDAWAYGFQPLEVVWEYYPKGSGVPGYYILPRAVIGKPMDWFSFNAANELTFQNKGVAGGSLRNDPVPERRFLVPSNNATYSNPYGVSLLSRCYWSVYFKRVMLRLWVTYSEKYGIPWSVVRYKVGTKEDEVRKIVKSVKDAVADAVLAVPTTYEPSLSSPQGAASVDVFGALIAFCNDEISKAVLGHTGGMTSTPGKLGNENTANDAKYDKKLADKEMVEQSLNTLIRWIYELNFDATNDGELPTFALYDEEDVDTNLANRDKVLYDQGVRFTAEYYATTYGILPAYLSIAPPADGRPVAPAPAFRFAQGGTPGTDPGDVQGREATDQLQSPGTAELDNQARGVVDPLIEAVQSSASYAEALAKVAALYPQLDASTLGAELARSYFLISLAGSLAEAGGEE